MNKSYQSGSGYADRQGSQNKFVLLPAAVKQYFQDESNKIGYGNITFGKTVISFAIQAK